MDEEGEEIEGVPAFFHRHPLLFCFLLFLAFTYAFVYPVFTFILASAPVLILTAFLLGLVLLNSVPQDHDPHVYKISHRPPQYQPTTAAAIGPRPTDESPPTSDSSSSSSADDDNYNRPTMSTATSHASFPDTAANSESESTDSDHEEKQQNHHQRSEKKEAVRAVAWTADDDKSIENIGSLELEMNATVEKLMSRRRARGHQRPLHHHHHHVMDLVDIDDPSKLSITTRKSNPFDLDGPYDEDDNFPDSAPSMLGLRPSRNPFFDDMDDNLHLQAPPQPSPIPGAGAAAAQKNAMLFRRHESFTVGAPYVSDFRPSRFRPYFVTEKMQGQPVTVPEASRKSSSSSTSSSSAGATAYAYAYTSANKEEEAAAEQEALAEAEAEAAAVLEEVKTEEYSSRSREVVAVDVELISDSSDDDMTLPGGHAGKQHQVQVQQQQQQVAEQEQQMKMEQQQQQQQAAEQEQRMKLQQLAEHEQRLKQQQQQLAEQEQRLKLQQQVAEQEQQMKMQQQQQHQLALSDEDDEGDSFEVESITKQVAAAAAGKTKQLEADPAYDYSPSVSAGKTEKKQQEAAFAPLPPVAPNKLQSMRRVFSEEDADEPWAAPSALEETGNEVFPLPPLPESAPSAGAAPPLSAAAKKAIGKSTKYKPPTKKAVLGFFRK